MPRPVRSSSRTSGHQRLNSNIRRSRRSNAGRTAARASAAAAATFVGMSGILVFLKLLTSSNPVAKVAVSIVAAGLKPKGLSAPLTTMISEIIKSLAPQIVAAGGTGALTIAATVLKRDETKVSDSDSED